MLPARVLIPAARGLLLVALVLLPVLRLPAKPLLANLNLNDGAKWELVGVKLWNVKLVPLQQELGTFIVTDLNVLQDLRRSWDFAPMFEDWCEYHYALKFYRNGRLVKTLRANLVCNYITDGVLSYAFDESHLRRLLPHRRKLPWIQVNFRDVQELRKAIRKVESTPTAYLYHDVEPFLHDGFFVLGADSLPLLVNRDSLMNEVKAHLKKITGRDDLHVTHNITFLNAESWKINIRFDVFCSLGTYEDYHDYVMKYADPSSGFRITAHWRHHLVAWELEEGLNSTEGKIPLVVVGLTQDGYYRMMKGQVP